MGKQSTRKNKTIYQLYREAAGLTRAEASLNEINPLTGRLIQIARDGKISDDEMKDFAYISKKLDEISLAIDSLNLWVDKTAGEQGLNLDLLNAEKEKLK